jgi:hypothetical protein
MDATTTLTTVTQLAASPAAAKLPRINWNIVETKLMLLRQVQAGCMHIGGKPGKAKGRTQGWEDLASTLCGKGPFKDFAEVKGPAMKKAYEAIVTAASSEFVNTSGCSSDSNSLY